MATITTKTPTTVKNPSSTAPLGSQQRSNDLLSAAKSMLAQTKAQGSTPYAGSSYEKSYLASSPTATVTNIPVGTTLDASQLGTTTAPIISSTPASTYNPNAVTTGNLAVGLNPDGSQKLTATTGEQTAVVDPATKAMEDYLAQTKKVNEEAQNLNENALIKAREQAGLARAQQEKTNISNALNAETTRMNLDLQNLRGVGAREGVTEAVYGQQSAEVTREAMTRILPLQAQLALAQDNLQLAQETTNQLFTAFSKDAQNQIDYRKQLIKDNYDIFTANEKKKLEAQNRKEDFAHSDYQNLVQSANQQALQALKDGNTGLYRAITNSIPSFGMDSASQAKIASFNKTLANAIQTYGTQSTPNINAGQYSSALSTILGSGKFTKEQTAQITRAINSGENPVAVIKNQAKQLLTGANQTKLENAEAVRDSMTALKDSLNDYYAAGGNTGLIKGNFEKVVNNLGQVQDPRLAGLAVEVQSQLQSYRNAISGTAYSDQEGKDIASVFPGINKSKQLNDAIFAGRDKSLNSQIDGLYKSALGSSYDSIKQIETPKQNLVIAPETSTEKNAWDSVVGGQQSSSSGFFSSIWKGLTGQ